ncbi:MAG: hypothetical protein ACTSPD_11625 [Promethearchaeota archaeon]
MIKKNVPFKNTPFSVLKEILILIMYGLVLAISVLSFYILFYLFYYYFSSYYYYDYYSFIFTIKTLVYILCFLTVLLVIFESAEFKSRGKVEISNYYEDYETFYKINMIPVVGKCRICGRAIPLYYGLKIKHRYLLSLMADLNICFQVDEAHITFLQRESDILAFNEFKFLYLNIKRWNRRYYLSHVLMLFWMIMTIIIWDICMPIFGFAYQEGYYNIISDIILLIFSIMFSYPTIWIWWFLIILPTRFCNRKQMLLFKRLYMDNEDFGCFVTAMTDKPYVRIGQGENERMPGLVALSNAIRNSLEFRRAYYRDRWKEIKKQKRRMLFKK